MKAVTDFFSGPGWSVVQVLINWLCCYMFWRLGKSRGRLESMAEDNRLLRVQHELITRMHHTLTVGHAHMENLRRRLIEARR